MKLCSKCVLPETFPSIRFDDAGLCNYCRDFPTKDQLCKKRSEYRQKFERLLKENMGMAEYDALLCYSGGRDSTYTLLIMTRHFRMKVLAFTLDNGFVSPQAIENIRAVTDSLGIDHLLFKPNYETLRIIFAECAKRNIYPQKTLQRASAICTACMSIVKFSALRMAIEKGIPLIAYGWSPGQAPLNASILKNNVQMLHLMQKKSFEPLYSLVGDAVRTYFLGSKHLNEGKPLPYNIHPLGFLEYDEEALLAEISKYRWQAPKDTDLNSTNCLLNAYANAVHKKQFGFHPYASELASMVRQGYLDRSVALARLEQHENPELIDAIRDKLGLLHL